MLAVARDNFDLTKYLVGEVMQSQDQRLDALRKFYPHAKAEDWRLETAGQRVQIIKKDAKSGGILQFGTELVASADGSLAALLGASPGASVTVSIMLDLIQRCFPGQVRSEQWQARLQSIFKANAKTLETDAECYRKVQAQSDQVLGLGPTAAA
jgi:malate dehydrogenase (quinone)